MGKYTNNNSSTEAEEWLKTLCNEVAETNRLKRLELKFKYHIRQGLDLTELEDQV